MKSNTRSVRKLYSVVLAGSLVGIVASFLQTVDKLTHLVNPVANLFCNINSVFSCNNVLDAWQSSFFGFPNSLMCLVFFSVTLGTALAGLSGNLSKWLRLTMHSFALFFLGFGAWYLYQSIYVINAVCIYCLFCYGAVIIMNASWLRINHKDLPFVKLTQRLINSKWDYVLWAIWAFVFVLAIFVKFYS